MIEHEGRYFNDMPSRPYELSRTMYKNFKNNQCEILVVSGMPEGIGKSAHVNHALADICGFKKEKSWDKIKWMWKRATERPKDTPIWEADYDGAKAYIKYPPEDIVNLCISMIEKGQRDVCIHWDDAGTWLNAMSWNDPFVISFMRYLSLARTNWGGVILSTPVEDWVLKKLHTAKGVIHVQVVPARGSSNTMVFRPRSARAYKFVRYAGNPKNYWQIVYEDNFTAIMPDNFYHWYKPMRDGYAKIATAQMKEALEAREKKYGSNVSASIILQEIEKTLTPISPPEDAEKHVGRANDKAEDFNELIDQTFASTP